MGRKEAGGRENGIVRRGKQKAPGVYLISSGTETDIDIGVYHEILPPSGKRGERRGVPSFVSILVLARTA